MNRILTSFSILAVAGISFLNSTAAEDEKLYTGEPIKALLITGGCCHNYVFQAATLLEATAAQTDIEWVVVNEGGNGTSAMIELYNDPDWARLFDVVVHNECFADTTDPEYIRKITAAHEAGVPAVVIHCAMHTYRSAEIDDWRKFLGVTSRRHEHRSEYPVKIEASDHPIMKGFPSDWVTPSDELYVVEKLWPGAKALATSVSERTGEVHPIVWTNDFNGVRVVGTTYGHSDDTFRDPVFRDLLTRAIVWAVGKM